jgi:hypothetical protein
MWKHAHEEAWTAYVSLPKMEEARKIIRETKTSMRIHSVLALALTFCAGLAGCGGSSGGTTPTPTPQPANITGQWTFTAVDTAGNKTAVFANLTAQGSGNYFATGANSATCDLTTAQCQVVNNTPNINITVSSTNQLQLTLSNIINIATGQTETVNATGTVNAMGTQMTGNWTAQSGASGTWQGQTAASFTGSYSGTVNSTVAPSAIPVGVSLSITQDASYNLTASAVLTNSLCFSTLSFGGHAVGGAFYLVSQQAPGIASGGIVVAGIENNFSAPNTLLFGYQVLSGCDAGDQGQGTITRQ